MKSQIFLKICCCSNFVLISKVLIFVCTFIHKGDGVMIDNNPYHRFEKLDPRGNYNLEFSVDINTQQVTFNVTVKTKGYVGFGLSRSGKMTGADIVIGGVRDNGKPYFADRHSFGNKIPELDQKQDWFLNNARENQTHTFLSFSRAFDTCDPSDYPITEDRIVLIWCYGETDTEFEYHYRNRGTFNIYLLHPDYSPPIVDQMDGIKSGVRDTTSPNVKSWTMDVTVNLEPIETTYWCQLFRAPTLSKKHHVVGLQVRFPNESSRRHLHHLLVHKCHAPRGTSAQRMFDRFTRHKGQMCYLIRNNPNGPIPTDYCTEIYTGWAFGGRSFFAPPHVGYPFGTSPDEYYVVQSHLDNPNKTTNVVNYQIDHFYTDVLRPNEGGFMFIGHAVPGLPPSLLIPPSSIDQDIYGYCGGGCTKHMFPAEGVSIIGIIPHTHNSGKRVRVQHFRGNTELPWIVNDDNYGNTFQQTLALQKDVKVLPGDILSIRCTNDNTWTNGTVVGGLATRQEMCEALITYYTRVDFAICRSEIVSEEFRQRILGVTNVTWDEMALEYVVDPPHPLAGMLISQVSDNHVTWDRQRRQELQRFQRTHPHMENCNMEMYAKENGNVIGGDYTGQTRVHSNAKRYRPNRSCSFVPSFSRHN